MDPWDIIFERELSKRIKTKLSHRQEQVAKGIAKSFEDYRYRCGEIAALIEIVKDIQDIRDGALGNTDSREN